MEIIFFMADLRKDFLVKFEDDSGGNRQRFLVLFVSCLLQFVSHLSRLGWVNKLHSNVFHSPTSSYRLISMFLFLFLFAFLLQFCNLCRLIRFHIALNFSFILLVCKKVFFCKTNFITDLTLLLHQLRALEIVSGNEIALLEENKKKKATFPFYFFHCFRIIVVIVAGAIQLMRFYWKTTVFLFVPGIRRSFYHPLKHFHRSGQLYWVKALGGNELMDFQFNFTLLALKLFLNGFFIVILN